MKELTRPISSFELNNFFSPIRNSINHASVLLNSIRLLLLNSSVFPDAMIPEGLITLRIDKMSRIIIENNNRKFSISFPFNVIITDDEIQEISTYSGQLVDAEVVSSALSVLQDENFRLNQSLLDYYSQPLDIGGNKGVYLLEEIMFTEAAYVRCDHDPNNENGKRHPLDHLDINYSSYGTYKLGTHTKYEREEFIDTMNINTDCKFLH